MNSDLFPSDENLHMLSRIAQQVVAKRPTVESMMMQPLTLTRTESTTSIRGSLLDGEEIVDFIALVTDEAVLVIEAGGM